MVEASRSPSWWLRVRWLLGLALGVVVLVILFSHRHELHGASHVVDHMRPLGAVLAVALETLSLMAFAMVQRRILGVGGVHASWRGLIPVTLANNSIANTLPGAPAFAGAFRFRQYRLRGANSSVAGWAVFTQLIAATTSLALIVLVGVVIAVRGGSARDGVATTLVALVVVGVLGYVFARRHSLAKALTLVLRVVKRLTGHPRGNAHERVDRLLATLRTLHVSRRDQLAILGWEVVTWLLDAGCLVASFYCVRGSVPWSGFLLAYAVAQLVSGLPIVPGGIGLVEGSLTVVLVAYGAPRVYALSAVIIYRLISFWFTVLVGWICFGVMTARDHAVAKANVVALREPLVTDN